MSLWLAATALLAGPFAGAAVAETRTLTIYHTHSKETATITFKRGGQYDRAGLEQLNHILRDWRTDEKISMDPQLFDVVWEVHREVGAREPVHVVSAYRSPATNAMLRRRSRAVAEQSHHTRGKALDFFIPDVATDKVRSAAMRLQGGGVGYYPSSYNAFVHLDVGSVRAWPRMTQDQLARLFPDGKTVHLPKDGKPLARYNEAKAEIMARGGAVSGFSHAFAQDDGVLATKRFWARLLGGGADEAEDREAAQNASQHAGARPVMASVTSSADDSGQRPAALTWLDRLSGQAEPQPRLVAGLPLPVRRPGSDGDAAKGALIPTPPRRPGTDVMAQGAEQSKLAALDVPLGRPSTQSSRGLVDDAVPSEGSTAGGDANVFKIASDHPLPPLRPDRARERVRNITSRIDVVHRVNPTYASERSLTSLYAVSVTGTVQAQATAKVREAESISGTVPSGAARFDNARFDGVAMEAGSAARVGVR